VLIQGKIVAKPVVKAGYSRGDEADRGHAGCNTGDGDGLQRKIQP
jgi:hypothetical protein